jgi:hypothetical protein
MKRLLIVLALVAISLTGFSQVNARHLFGTITANDISANATVSNLKGVPTSTSVFLRLAIAETAFEIPLFAKAGNPPQYFAATGIGASLTFWKVKDLLPVERFTLNGLLFTPNQNPGSNISTAITIGVPVPGLELPLLNAGFRYDWKARVAYIQTGVTLEF